MFGWHVNGWRLEAREKDRLEDLSQRLNARLIEQSEAFQLAADTLRSRETVLITDLQDERELADRLREEISNASVVTITQRVEVPANCPDVPQCAVVDSLRFRDLYNRAATGALPDPPNGDLPMR